MKDDIILLAIVALAAYLFWRNSKSETEKAAEQEADGQEEEHTFLLGFLPSTFVGPFSPIPKPRPTIIIGNTDKTADINESYDYDTEKSVNKFIGIL